MKNTLTTKDLKNEKWGTPCGHPPKNKTGLSNHMVIDFIDIFFCGELTNLDLNIDEKMVFGGNPILKKLKITQDEFNKFVNGEKQVVYDLIDWFCGEYSKNDFKDVENKIDLDQHPVIICWLFRVVVERTGSSFRVDYMGDGEIDLESE